MRQRPFLEWIANLEQAKREILLASALLMVLLAVGTAGYMLIEQWDWLDGLYMTFITLTTIGFNEVNTLSDLGRFFTICIGVVGIGTVAFIATRTAQIVLTSQAIRLRHMSKMIRQLDGHYIIAGYGRIGSRIAHDLKAAGKQFVVIDDSSDKIEASAKAGFLHVQGDAQIESTLTSAKIESAKGLILTLPEDSANVFVTLTARELNPELFIMVRTDTQKNSRKLVRAGADKVVAAYEIGADRMAQVILRPHVDQFMEEVLLSNDLDLNMHEVTVEKDSLLAGKTLAESKFRQQFDAIVIASLERTGDGMNFNPSADTMINEGDILIVLGSRAMIERLKEIGCAAQSRQ